MHERDSTLHLKKSMPKQKWTNRICRLIPNEGNLISIEKQAQKTEISIKELHTKNHLNTKK